MSSDDRVEYFPVRADNIPSDGTQTHESGYPADEIEETPGTLARTHSSTDHDPETPPLTRSGTTRSQRLSRRNTFEPIHIGDRQALERLASQFSGTEDLARIATRASATLDRQDTLAGIGPNDPVLDPQSPHFDVYKWVRMV